MKAGKVWPQRVVRRALFAIPFCMLFNALVIVLIMAYINGMLDEWMNSESLEEISSAAFISIVFIAYVFLAFFYQLCLGAVKRLGHDFRIAFYIGWIYVISRIITILVYGYLYATPPEMVNESDLNFVSILQASGQLEYLMNILDGVIIILLLHGFETLLPEKKDRTVRRVIQVFRWISVLWVIYLGAALLTTMSFMDDAVWLRRITRLYTENYILAFTLQDIVSFAVLLTGTLWLRKKEAVSATAA